MSSKKTLILSIGAHQLISIYSLLKQKGLLDNIAGIIRIAAHTEKKNSSDEIEKSEQWLYKIFNLKYYGKYNSPFDIWGKSQMKKFINLPLLKSKLRKQLLSIVPEKELKNINEIALAYRNEITDSLIYNSFQDVRKIHFVTDGSVTIFSNSKLYKLPFYIRFLNLRNLYSIDDEVWFPKYLLPEKHYNINPKVINNNIYNDILEKITSNRDFDIWIKKIMPFKDEIKTSVLFMHPLSAFTNEEKNVEFYINLLKKETSLCENKILVKFHPRENEKSADNFTKKIKNLFKNKVFFFDKHFFANLPFEIYMNKIKVNKVITLLSTAVFYYKNQKEIEISVYNSDIYPENIQRKVEETANFMDIKTLKI